LTPYQNQKLDDLDAVSWFKVSWFGSIGVESLRRVAEQLTSETN